MELIEQPKTTKTTAVFDSQEQVANEMISIEECKQFVAKFDLSDQKVGEIRNYMIGVIDKTINSYLDNFK